MELSEHVRGIRNIGEHTLDDIADDIVQLEAENRRLQKIVNEFVSGADLKCRQELQQVQAELERCRNE